MGRVRLSSVLILFCLFIPLAVVCQASTPASMLTPTPGARLLGTSQTFTWNTGTGVSKYALYVGTASGRHDIADVENLTTTSTTVSNLPSNGSVVYVSLRSFDGTTWVGRSYAYLATGSGMVPATMTSPAPGTKFTSQDVTFYWSKGTGPTQYRFQFGTTPGGSDIANVTSTTTGIGVGNLPAAGQKLYVTLGSYIGTAWFNRSYSYTATGTPITFQDPKNIDNGLIKNPYVAYFNVSGGTSGYTLSLASGTIPPGLTFSNDGQGWLSGTPTTAGTYSFTVRVRDSNDDIAISPKYTIVISDPGAAHNSWLKGRYVCSFEGYGDPDGSRYAVLASMNLDGAGHGTGIYDMNSRVDGTQSGTLTATYSLGAGNNGSFTVVAASDSGPDTLQYAVMADHPAGPTASMLQLVLVSDVLSQKGQHGAGTCYLASTSAFAASSITGHSFVFVEHGENSTGIPQAAAGRLVASGGTFTSGVIDLAAGKTFSRNLPLTGGTYAAPDATTGRFTYKSSSGTGPNSLGYIINADHFLIMDTVSSSKPAVGAFTGHMFRQHQSSYSAANLNGNFVMNDVMWEFDTNNLTQRSMAEIIQGQGDGAGKASFNVSYHNERDTAGNGSFDTSTGESVSISVPATGRVPMSEGNGITMVMYFYDNTSAVAIAGGLHSSSGLYNVQVGYLEPQTLTAFTDAAVAGTYLGTNAPRIGRDGGNSINLVTISSTGTVTGIEDDGGGGYMGYANKFSLTYDWLSSTYGVIGLSQAGQPVLTCMAITTKRFVCLDNNAKTPSVSYGQRY